MKKSVFFSLIMCLILASCNSNKKQEAESMSHLPLNERINRIFAENKEEKIQFDLKFAKEIKDLYTLNGFQSLWIENDSLTLSGKKLLQLLDSSYYHGLPPNLYPINQLKNEKDPLQIELGISESLFRLLKHIQFGILDSAKTSFNWNTYDQSDAYVQWIHQTYKDSNFINRIDEFHPQNFQYQYLLKAWRIYLSKTDLDTSTFFVPGIKKDSTKSYEIARSILVHKKYLDSIQSDDNEVFLKALEKYQEDHILKGDHVIGSNTAKALEKSEWDKFKQLVISLEKYKWKQKLPQKYFRVNIGEQKLRLIDSNRFVREHRIIVGHYDTQTPELESKLKRMVLFPYWNVPHSISSKELIYGARRDTAYWRKNGYKVFRGKTEIDPSTVNWRKYDKNKFPFRIRQEPGPKNSLGLIKFLFPNKYSVYLHDTPTKWLFRTKMRYYSHGCMRLEDPKGLAHYLIATDPKNRFIADSLEVELEKAERQSISLRKPIPIYVEYITVGADSTGNIYFHLDHYGRDEKYIESIFGY